MALQYCEASYTGFQQRRLKISTPPLHWSRRKKEIKLGYLQLLHLKPGVRSQLGEV